MQEQPRIRVIDDLRTLQDLVPAWNDLLAALPNATIFSTWEWLSSWWHAYGEGRQLLTLAYFDPAAELLGIAPLSLETSQTPAGVKLRLLRLMGDGSTDSDNLDMPVRPGRQEEFAAAVLDWLEEHSDRWELAQFNTLPDDSPVGLALLKELANRGWTHSCLQQSGTVIDLPDDWETYRAMLSYNERGQLGKYIRRLERKYDVQVRKCSAGSELEPWLAAFFEVHQKRWQAEGEAGTFALPARREFYRELSRRLLDRGWLEFWMLELNGTPVGGEFDFRYRDTIYSLQVGFHPDYSADRIGYVLRGYLLQRFIAQGIRHYDFLGGEGGYKDRWAGRMRYYSNIHFGVPRSRGSAYLRLVDTAGRGKEWLRRHLPSKAWAALHWVNKTLQGK